MTPTEATRTRPEREELGQQIQRLLGAGRVREPIPPEAAACEVVVEPESIDEIRELVRKCETDRLAVAPLGSARTLSEIRTSRVAFGVSLARMRRVIAYEPGDMTIVAEAGVTLGELNRLCFEHRQRLPVDPREPDRTTVGAMVGASHAGPTRLSEGTVRDLLIGVGFVGHGGRLARGGGRVVKNVAGYDLMKVMTGSFGTLGIVVEAAFKVRPIPENYSLAVRRFRRDTEAFEAAATLNEALAMVHLEVLSPGPSAALGYDYDWVVMAGFAGNRAELDYQRAKIVEVLGSEADMLEGACAESSFASLRDMDFPADGLVAQIAVKPAELARCARECSGEYRAHAGSGVAQVWFEEIGEGTAEQTVTRWREMARRAGGSLRVLRAPETMRAEIEFFDRPSDGAFSLMKRLKQTFDPANIFNPGCFVGGL